MNKCIRLHNPQWNINIIDRILLYFCDLSNVPMCAARKKYKRSQVDNKLPQRWKYFREKIWKCRSHPDTLVTFHSETTSLTIIGRQTASTSIIKRPKLQSWCCACSTCSVILNKFKWECAPRKNSIPLNNKKNRFLVEGPRFSASF